MPVVTNIIRVYIYLYVIFSYLGIIFYVKYTVICSRIFKPTSNKKDVLSSSESLFYLYLLITQGSLY